MIPSKLWLLKVGESCSPAYKQKNCLAIQDIPPSVDDTQARIEDNPPSEVDNAVLGETPPRVAIALKSSGSKAPAGRGAPAASRGPPAKKARR